MKQFSSRYKVHYNITQIFIVEVHMIIIKISSSFSVLLVYISTEVANVNDYYISPIALGCHAKPSHAT